MSLRSTIRLALIGGTVGIVVGCADPKSEPGTDRETRSTATMVTWSDGNPAISIACESPGGCQRRALAMCKGGNYTVLNMDNMPTRGDARSVRGPASVAVRCN